MGTSQSAIARMESGNKPSLRSLERYAEAVGMRLELRFVPQDSRREETRGEPREETRGEMAEGAEVRSNRPNPPATLPPAS
ncbi:MAG: hypothetical protein HQL51_11615 [Magnetococcales bacterium]|nr:hypothetical protein [Magnetococcales bacterium]